MLTKLKIIPIKSQKQFNKVKCLLQEYADLLKQREDCGFEELLQELPNLQESYRVQDNILLAAYHGETMAGCGALHKLSPEICEIKRVYVSNLYRGKGIGRAITVKLIRLGKTSGYSFMRLGTTPMLHEAIALYKSLGFKEIEPYYDDPFPGALFMELELS